MLAHDSFILHPRRLSQLSWLFYTIPMSTKAAVYAMKMTIGKRTITARISEKRKSLERLQCGKIEWQPYILARTKQTECIYPELLDLSVQYPDILTKVYEKVIDI